MSVPGNAPSERREGGGEERIEVRRYLDAVRGSARLIAAIAVVITGGVIGLSLVLPPTYQATATLVLEESTTTLGQADATSTERRLATARRLLTTRRILDAARKEVGAKGGAFGGSIKSSVDSHANIINVLAKGEKPEVAAMTANAVSEAFLAERADLDRRRISAAQRTVQQKIDELSERSDSTRQIAALRERLSELDIAESNAGADLELAERAKPPSGPVSPRPLRNAILALFASVFLGILVVLARDQLAPQLSSRRDLSRILELPVLIGVPHVRRSRRAKRSRMLSGIEQEAYQTLRATMEFSASGSDDRVILITSALRAEGKTSVTSRLGRELAKAGHRTLVLSADLRVPRLHEQFGLSLGVGLTDILSVLDWEAKTGTSRELLERATNVLVAPPRDNGNSGCLHVITSGTKAKDPARLASSQAMRAFLAELRGLDYDYILVDGPPLLGLADSQVIAQWADAMLIVSRLGRITLENAGDLREVLDRLETRALGIVLIGVRGEVSPYYLTGHAAIEGGKPDAFV